MCMGACYFGSYISDDKYKRDWLREHTLVWEKNISTISGTGGKYPQENYAAVVHAIQPEWIFLHHATWDTRGAFTGVEKMIWETFFFRLFFGKMKTLSPIVGSISTMLVKKAGLGLLNTVTSAQEKYLSYQRGIAELFQAVTGG